MEKFSYDKKYKDIMPIIVNNLALLVIKENPSITPIYPTQFSNIKSNNSANKASFKMAIAFISAD